MQEGRCSLYGSESPLHYQRVGKIDKMLDLREAKLILSFGAVLFVFSIRATLDFGLSNFRTSSWKMQQIRKKKLNHYMIRYRTIICSKYAEI